MRHVLLLGCTILVAVCPVDVVHGTTSGTSTIVTPAGPQSNATGGVITTSPAVAELITEGVAHSATFAAVVADLQASDILVTIEPALDLPHGMSGCTAFAARTALRRYLRVSVDPRQARADRIATIGHELWHAREVARHPEVVTTEGFRKLYATAITGRPLRGRWDSDGAVAAGERILRELASSPATRR